MRNRFVAGIAIPAALSVIAVAGCGSNSSGGGTGSSGSGHTVVIGMSAPLTGSLSAARSRHEELRRPRGQAGQPGQQDHRGWTIKFDPQDDQADAERRRSGRGPASPSETDLVGIVGTLNSSVAQQEQQALQRPEHRQDLAGQHQPDADPGRRTSRPATRRAPTSPTSASATTDAIQGPFAAQYLNGAEHQARSRRSTTRRPTAPAWSRQFDEAVQEATAARSRPHQTINPGDKDFSGVISKIKPTGAAGRLLRRRVPGGRSAVEADEGRRAQRPADGRRRHLRPDLHQAGGRQVRR